jgi:hypothetical protein
MNTDNNIKIIVFVTEPPKKNGNPAFINEVVIE